MSKVCKDIIPAVYLINKDNKVVTIKIDLAFYQFLFAFMWVLGYIHMGNWYLCSLHVGC